MIQDIKKQKNNIQGISFFLVLITIIYMVVLPHLVKILEQVVVNVVYLVVFFILFIWQYKQLDKMEVIIKNENIRTDSN